MYIIRYPKCGGGHWLGNLIWHLQNAQWTLPLNGVTFDDLPQGSVKLTHWLDGDPNGTLKFYYKDHKDNVLFSTDKKFTMYINFCIKQLYGQYHMEQLPLSNQILNLSNTAVFVLTDSYIDHYYCHNIDLDYCWIFQDPSRFCDWVCNFLDINQVPYYDNREYMHISIDNYKKTCADPKTIVGNLESTIWLGWLNAVSILNSITLDGEIAHQTDLKSIATILEPTYTKAKEVAEQNLFNWTYESTTR